MACSFADSVLQYSGGVRWLVALLLLASQPDPVSLSVYPQSQLAPLYRPATVRLRIIVERDPRNRWLTYAFISEDFETSETVNWPGEFAPRTLTKFYDLPAGEYTAIVTVIRELGEKTERTCRFTIVGAEP